MSANDPKQTCLDVEFTFSIIAIIVILVCIGIVIKRRTWNEYYFSRKEIVVHGWKALVLGLLGITAGISSFLFCGN